MKSGTSPAPIKIRRYGKVPPPAVELEDSLELEPVPPGSPWRIVAIVCAGVAFAASAAASVAFLFG